MHLLPPFLTGSKVSEDVIYEVSKALQGGNATIGHRGESSLGVAEYGLMRRWVYRIPNSELLRT